MVKNILVMAAFLFVGVMGSTAGANEIIIKQYEPALTIIDENADRHNFTVEIAQTAEQQERGLMGRWALDEDAGMLFLFTFDRKPTFWMKDTFIPLDMIFIENDGRIQHIHHNAEPQNETYITSPNKIRAVLEVNGGTAARLGIKEGDYVYHSFFKNLNLLAK